MTQNEQNYINKINEMQDVIECQKKAIAERNSKIEELESLYSCDGCINKPLEGENYDELCGQCRRFYGDHYTILF